MVAPKVKFGNITSSPLPMPNDANASSIAAVPFVTDTPYPPPTNFANFLSNFFT